MYLNRNIKMTKINIKTLVTIVILFAFSSCTKEVGPEDAVSKTFFRQYSSTVSEANTYLEKTSNGYLMAGFAHNNDKLFISHCDDLGHLDWDKEIPIDRDFFSPQGLKLKDGSFIINDYSNPVITKITEEGVVEYSRWIDSELTSGSFIYSPVVESTNGMCYISYSLGSGTGSKNRNYISEIDPSNGSETKYYRYDDSDISGKIMTFKIIKAEGNTFWLNGSLLGNNSSWNWSDPLTFFTARITGSSINKVKIYEDSKKKDQVEIASLATKDDHLVMITSSYHHILTLGSSRVFKLNKVDLDLNDIWEKEIDLGVNSISPKSITEANNGDFIISGGCVERNQTEKSGFIARLNSSGDIVESKIFNLGQGHHFSGAINLPDNSYLFTGGIENFGKGKELQDRFYLKTDSDFNY
ncbi:MAG: hypothetical protein ACI9M3_001431 [Bacteroidia bacterium]|jgi:hypothetical protein